MDCMYCQKDDQLDRLMKEVICFSVLTVYFYREQSYPGRCVLVLNRHVHKLTDLPEEEYLEFFREVRITADALKKLYKPDKINYLVLGDRSPHLHIHLVPKYREGRDWGQIFQMMPEPSVFLKEEEYERQIELLRDVLTGKQV